jgi:hypothetical protein
LIRRAIRDVSRLPTGTAPAAPSQVNAMENRETMDCMIRPIVCAALIVFIALPLPAATRRVLLAVHPDEQAVEPIVLLDPMQRPPDEFTFADSYTLSMDGKPAGSVRTKERVRLGCVSTAAKVQLSGEGNFATNFETTPVAVREATADETAMLLRWARLFLLNHGIPQKHVAELETHVDVVDPGDGDPLFVATFTTTAYEQPGGAAFLIARTADVSATSVVPQYARFNERDTDSKDRLEPLFGALDVDGDGVAELVTQRHHKEGYDYVVYRCAGGRWKSFAGGGSGC